MNPTKPLESGYQSRVRTSSIRLARWTGIWVVSCALMSFGPKFLWNKAVVLTVLAAALNVAVGTGMILANKKYLAELDELQRKIYLDALGITVGVVVIVAIPYSTLRVYNAFPFEANVAHLTFLMVFTFMASLMYGSRRYR